MIFNKPSPFIFKLDEHWLLRNTIGSHPDVDALGNKYKMKSWQIEKVETRI